MVCIAVETILPASPDRVWAAVQRPDTLQFVSAPLLYFRAVRPPTFPERWEAKDYLAALRLFGWLPVGRQVISVSFPAPSGPVRQVRDNGHSVFIRRWDHLITIEAAPGGTRYRDSLELEVGLLTPFVTAFARRFYAHRQSRWKALIARDWDPTL